MENQIVKIDYKEYGLEEVKAKQIEEAFKPMLEMMVNLEEEYNILASEKISIDKVKRAKELRLRYVKIRTDTAKIHKELKAFYLAGGRFVDGWKNAQIFASQGIEEKLMSFEKHYENLEKKRIEKLQSERMQEYEKYGTEIFIDLGSMSNEVWENFISGVKLQHKAKIEAEEKAEQERLEQIKKEKAEQERIKKENEELKKAQEKAEKERKEAEEKLRIEREAREKSEREAQEKAEKERKEAEDAKRKLTEGNDLSKWKAYVKNLNNVPIPEFKTKKYNEILAKLKEIIS